MPKRPPLAATVDLGNAEELAALRMRKGARDTRSIPPRVLELMELGVLETVNLSEWLVVDQLRLARRVLDGSPLASCLPAVEEAMAMPSKTKVTAKMATERIGQAILGAVATQGAPRAGIKWLREQPSDIVRSWACYLVGWDSKLSLAKKLAAIEPSAADLHFGVREFAWLAMRGAIGADPLSAIALLQEWTKSDDANVRRFATESTRPRGVWCAHIDLLKQQPQAGLPLLEPLRSDPSKYVQDSVANWLNDAAKSKPQWVQSIAKRWTRESPTPQTQATIKRATRSLRD
jgi:3-methyladenine DNA glycosylase AlkC